MAPQFEHSRIKSYGSTRSGGGVYSLKSDHLLSEKPLKPELNKSAYHSHSLYAGKIRKCAEKTKSRNRHSTMDPKGGNSGVQPFKNIYKKYEHSCDRGKKRLGNEIEEFNNPNLVRYQSNTKFVPNKGYDQTMLLKEFRHLYRRLNCNKIPQQSVRTDYLAWKVMKERHGKYLQPAKTIGHVRGVEIGDSFYLRLELMIMGIHFQSMCGIDSKVTDSYNTLLATSVVATQGYEDNMIDSNVLRYTGEGGGNFANGNNNKGIMVKDQVLKRGNLALRNSMKARTVVRVIRGMKRGSMHNRPIFVYDGLYKVNDCRAIKGHFGNKQFVFTLVRCAGQKQINWANYK